MPNAYEKSALQGKKSRADFLAAYAKHRNLDTALDEVGHNRAWLYKNTARWPDFKAGYQAMRRHTEIDGENHVTEHSANWDHSFSGFRAEFLNRQSPWFHEQISEAMDAQTGGDIMLVICPPESGKAEWIGTEIPTPHGWTTMGVLRVGDEVFSRDGSPTRVRYTSPVFNDHDCYRVAFSGGSSAIVDAGHLWHVRRRDRSWKDRATGARGYRTDTIATVELAERCEHLGRPNFSVPVLGALDLPDADLPIDPYVLGTWLGDGTCSNGTISKPEPELWANIELAGYATSKPRGRQGMTRTVYGLHVQLRALGVLNNKHIPAAYLRASAKQRMALLQGLMDTDGSCGTRGNCEFSSTTRALADGAEELIRTLGMKVRRYETRAMLNGRDYGPNYRFSIWPDEPVFRIQRKAERQRHVANDRSRWETITSVERIPTVPTRCIQVDAADGLYVTGREMHVTHNTSMAEDRCTMDVCVDPTTRITIGKSKIDFAKLMVATVRQRLTTGVFEYWRLHERFGPFMPMLGVNAFNQPQVWTQDAFNVFKRKLGAERDFNMVALGFGAEVAGTRTDRLYLDDVQSRKTLNLTDKILETMRDDWLTRPGTTGNTAILMNVVGDDDIADRLFDDQLLTNRFIYKAYDEAYLELGPRPTKDGGWEVSPWLWPERYSEADYERMRAIAGPEGWARKYQQDWRPSVGRSFTQEMIDVCQNPLRKLSHPPVKHPAGKPAEIACSIDPAFKRTAVASAAFEPTIMRMLDINAESNLRTTSQMIDMLTDQIRHFHRPGISTVKWVIVETKGMQQGIATDDAMLELQAEVGFEIIEQLTGWDKHDEDFGVAQMARSMTRAELDFPAGDQQSLDRFEDLYREMKNWRPEIRAKNRGNKLRQDGLMATWFLWTRWHKQRRSSIRRGSDASQFGFGAIPTMPGVLVPAAPIRAPDLSGWRF